MQPANITATLARNRPSNPSDWSAANALNRFLIAEPSVVQGINCIDFSGPILDGAES